MSPPAATTTTTAAEGAGGGGDLSGTIKIDGSSTVGPFAQAAAEEFQGENPDVKISVGTSGTGGGFEKFCAGETDISDASRPIKDDEEVPLCKKDGVDYKEVQVANDGIAVVTNKAIKIDCMTTDELKKLWNQGSKVTNYNEIDPKFPDTEVSLFGPGTDSGTFDFFTDEINGEEGVIAQGLPAVRGRQRARPGRRGRRGRPRLLRLLLLRAEPGQAEPRRRRRRRRLRQAEHRDDPGRQLQAAVAAAVHVPEREVAHGKPEVKAFMDYVVENQDEIAEAAQIVPLTDEQADKAKPDLGQARRAGTAGSRQHSGTRARPALGVARRRYGEEVIKALLFLAALISVLTTTGIVSRCCEETLVFFGDVGFFDFLFGTDWSPLIKPQSFGVLPARAAARSSSPASRCSWRSRSAWAPRST